MNSDESAPEKNPLHLDEAALLHDLISVSAGQRGLQMILAPHDLQFAAAAELVNITKPKA
jgi:Cys-tRNA(Pro)/Cys-tRNA(Cys) deacylase